MRYDLIDLRLFLHVADELNLSRGAARSHMAASSASLRISGLEEALGCTLLIRQARGVALTPAGRILLEHARRCLAQLEQMQADLSPYTDGLASHVSLFANNNAISAFLPEDLADFFSIYPQVRVSLEERTSHDILAAVSAGRADLGIVAWERDQHGLQFMPYREDELVLIVAADRAMARRKSIRFADCIQEPFISLPSGTAIHTFIATHAAALGQTLDIRIQVLTYDGIARLVAAGAGVAIVPKAVLKGTQLPIVQIRLSESWALRMLKICIRHTGETDSLEETGTMARRLAKHLVECGQASK